MLSRKGDELVPGIGRRHLHCLTLTVDDATAATGASEGSQVSIAPGDTNTTYTTPKVSAVIWAKTVSVPEISTEPVRRLTVPSSRRLIDAVDGPLPLRHWHIARSTPVPALEA